MFINVQNNPQEDIKTTWLASRSYMAPVFQRLKEQSSFDFQDYTTKIKNEISRKSREYRDCALELKDEIKQLNTNQFPVYVSPELSFEHSRAKWLIIYESELRFAQESCKISNMSKINDDFSSLSCLAQVFPFLIDELNSDPAVIDNILLILQKQNPNKEQIKLELLKTYERQHPDPKIPPAPSFQMPISPTEDNILLLEYVLSKCPEAMAPMNSLLEIITRMDCVLSKKPEPVQAPTPKTDATSSSEESKQDSSEIQRQETVRPKKPKSVFVEFSTKLDPAIDEMRKALQLDPPSCTQDKKNLIYVVTEYLFRKSLKSGATFGLLDPTNLFVRPPNGGSKKISELDLPKDTTRDLPEDMTAEELFTQDPHLSSAKEAMEGILFEGTPMGIIKRMAKVQDEISAFVTESKRKNGEQVSFLEFDEPFSVFIAMLNVVDLPILPTVTQYVTCLNDKHIAINEASGQLYLVSWQNLRRQSEANLTEAK